MKSKILIHRLLQNIGSVLGSISSAQCLWKMPCCHVFVKSISPGPTFHNFSYFFFFRGKKTKQLIIISFIYQVVLLSLILVLRKRLQFTVQLFQIVGKIMGRIPFLLFQPLWTFLILIIFWVFWVAVLLSLGTAGKCTLCLLLMNNLFPKFTS